MKPKNIRVITEQWTALQKTPAGQVCAVPMPKEFEQGWRACEKYLASLKAKRR